MSNRPALAAALLAIWAVGARAEPATLEDVMDGMSKAAGIAAQFREVKEMALLIQPLETRGELYFIPPDRLARITTEPGRAHLRVHGDHVQLLDETGGEAIDLSGDPVARLVVENFIVLFRGDVAALRERYEVDFHADATTWTLSLTPRRAPVDRFVARIELRGEGRVLRSMLLLERDGDQAETFFEEVDVDHHFSPAEIERLFAPPKTGAEH